MKLSTYYNEVNPVITSVPLNTVGIYCHMGILESAMGIAGEVGEIIDACLQNTNLKEEVGDCMYYICKMAHLICGDPDVLVSGGGDTTTLETAMYSSVTTDIEDVPNHVLFIHLNRQSTKIVDTIKKIYFKGIPQDNEALIIQLRYLTLSLTLLSMRFGVRIDDALSANIEKLKERYAQ